MKENKKMSTSYQGKDECVIELTHPWGEPLEERLMTRESSRDNDLFSIYKVPPHIRKQDESAYEPKIISFGPYHRGKENLKDMEMVKTHYLRQFLDRNPTKRLNDYLEEMKKLEEKARKCYSEEIVMQSDRFTEMMLLDGCFIIEFLFRDYGNSSKRDLFKGMGWAIQIVTYDMLVLENQLPFFILTTLFDLAGTRLEENKTLIEVMIESFNNEIYSTERMIKFVRKEEIYHALHLFHLCISSIYDDLSNESRQSCWRSPLNLSCFKADENSEEPPEKTEEPQADENSEEPPENPEEPRAYENSEELFENPEKRRADENSEEPPQDKEEHADENFQQPPKGYEEPRADENFEEPPEDPEEERTDENSVGPRHLIQRCWRKLSCFRGADESSEEERDASFIPSAVQLQEVGIKFHEKKDGGFMGVTFSKGVLEMTKFEIDDHTNSLLRNLLALEECRWDIGIEVICFAQLMDCLVNRPVDVALLQVEGVLINFLGSEEAAVDLFNHICQDLVPASHKHYQQIFNDVTKHYNSRWSKWRAKLVRDYFSSPWAFLSLMAAILLLGLTIQQSVYAILAYKKN